MHLAGARPPFPWLTHYVVPLLAVSFSVAIRPSVLVKLAVLSGLFALLLRSVHFDTGETYRNYSTGTGLGTLWFTALHLLVLSDPIQECRHETHARSLADSSLLARTYHALCVMINTRGIGWSYQIKQHPPLPGATRSQFVLTRMFRVCWYALLVDMFQVLISLNPIFWLPEDQARSLRSQGSLMTVVNVLAYAGRGYCSLNMNYDLIALVAVALRLSQPKYWPAPFGRWRDAYTIRRFWGRVWQQWLRRFIASTGRFTARILGCTKGTWLSSHVQLLVGFVASGLAHVPGDAMVGLQYTGCSFWFFPAQAVAITAEDLVISGAERLGIRETSWTRLVGYTWTFVWLMYTTPWFIDWAVKSGQAQDKAIPFSVVGPLLDYLAANTAVDVKGWVAAHCAL